MQCFRPNDMFGTDQMAFKLAPQCVPNCYCDQQSGRKRKAKKKVKGYKPPQTPPAMKSVVYKPCVHRHFKPDHVDRECLTREQYYDLLATPKGYPWLGEANCQNPELEVKNKSKKMKKRRKREQEECPTRAEAGDFADEFVEDMWDVMSPDITCRLIDFLVNEFGMSVEEAEDFIECKSCVGKQTICKKKKSKTSIGLGPKHKWVKELSDVFSKRIEQYIVNMLLTRRTPRTKRIAEKILDSLCDLMGEKTTLQNPKTKIQRIMVLISDRLALWIDDMMNDIDKPHKKRISITDEEESDKDEEEVKDVEGEEEGQEGEEGEEAIAEEEEKEPPKDTVPEEKDKTPEKEKDDKTDATPEKEEEIEPEPVQDKPPNEPEKEEKQPTMEEKDKEPEQQQERKEEQQAEEEPDQLPPEEQKEVSTEEKTEEPAPEETPPDVPPQAEEETRPVDDTEEPPKAEKEEVAPEEKAPPQEETPVDEEAALQEETPAEETPAEEIPAEEIPVEETPTEEALPEQVTPAEEEASPQEEAPGPSEEEKPSEEEPVKEPQVEEEKIAEKEVVEENPPEEPETITKTVEKEQKKKPYGDAFDLVKEDIEGTPKDRRTDRQKADKDELIRRIEKHLASKDLDIQPENIDDTASRVAHWMEHVLGSTEPTGGARRKNPSPAYAVNLKTGSTLEVHKLSSGTVAQKTANARGIPVPPRDRKIPDTTSPMNVQSTQEWFDWANNIGNMADEWGKWLESKLTDAEKQIAEKKKTDPDFDFKKWRDQSQKEAHKWRVETEKIKGEGNLWNKKIDKKLNDQPETEVRSLDM